jgi:anionic cell wall polymer biosynthesis LytR-Cps2A-Psr (LCP) family protein
LPEVDVADELVPGPLVHAESAVPAAAAQPGPSAHRRRSSWQPGASASPAAPGQTVVARRSRAAQRAARKAAARRRNLLVLGAGALVLVLAVGALVFLTGGGDDQTGTVDAGRATQRTLLVQVTGPDGVAASSALVGVTAREETSSVVLVPSGLLVDVAGTGNIPFGETVTLPEPSAPAQALTDLLGVRVDDSWVLSQEGLAALVDAVGGVQAAVDVDVVTTNEKGEETVVARAGSQQLGGEAAAAYATYLAEGEPEQARLARFDDVLSGLLAALPEDRQGVVAAVDATGDGARSTLEPNAIATRLAGMAAAARAESLVSDVLPVTEIDTGSSVTSYGIDSGQVAAMMRSRFPGALQKDAGGEVLRVLVENGVGTPGLVEQARERLVADGFRFVNGGNAAEFGFEQSAVIIPDGTEQSVRRGQRVASSLGLPESSVTTSDRGQTVADIIVILGEDFTP